MKHTAQGYGITAITVTYGARWSLLEKVLHAAKSQGIDRAIVVENGTSEPIEELARESFGAFVDVVRLERNTGSAGGFKTGMRYALEHGAEFILLLDDDNQMQPGCLTALVAMYRRHSHIVPHYKLAVLAYRADRQADVAAKVPANGMEDDRAAFFGFNLRDLPFKLFRRTRWGRNWIARRAIAESVLVATAPYSGMYFHRSMLEFIGLPDERFLLYADDTDFSFRLTRAAGRIVLASDARLTDLDASWNVRSRFGNTFDALLMGDGDVRAYYSTRNNAYFERWSRGEAGVARKLNRAVYLAGLYVRAVMKGRQRRYALLVSAICDGEAGRLGEHPDFPLAQP